MKFFYCVPTLSGVAPPRSRGHRIIKVASTLALGAALSLGACTPVSTSEVAPLLIRADTVAPESSELPASAGATQSLSNTNPVLQPPRSTAGQFLAIADPRWRVRAIANFTAILTDQAAGRITAVSLENGKALWEAPLPPKTKEVGIWAGKVFLSSGQARDLQTGEPVPLLPKFEAPLGAWDLHQSRDGSTLFLAVTPALGNTQNYIFRDNASKVFGQFESTRPNFMQLPGSPVIFGQTLYDPQSTNSVNLPIAAIHAPRYLAATLEGVAGANPDLSPLSTQNLIFLPWELTPSGIATTATGAQANVNQPTEPSSTLAIRGRCTVYQLRPLPSLQLLSDFCGPDSKYPQIPASSPVALWGGISGANGRLWFYKKESSDAAPVFLTTSPESKNWWQVRRVLLTSPNTVALQVPKDEIHDLIIFSDYAGNFSTVIEVERRLEIDLVGAINTQRYLCTHPRPTESSAGAQVPELKTGCYPIPKN